MSIRLFVYGTLAPGRPNAHVLVDLPGTWLPATVRGRLLPQGWGAAAGFPGIVISDSGDQVAGYLFTSDALPAHWARLDAFEGEGYVRVTVLARLADGGSAEAQVYALAAAPAASPGSGT